jgi:hypothetical protein
MKIEVKKKMNEMQERCCTKVTEESEPTRKLSGQCDEKSSKHGANVTNARRECSKRESIFRSASTPWLIDARAQNFIVYGLFCIYNEDANLRGSMINGGFR